MRIRHLAALVVLAVIAIIWPYPGVERAAAVPPGYVEPVAGEVVDPFRPPASPYGAGNRGWEYQTAPGAAVSAAGEGVVLFAGPVAGSLHVTVGHPDGLRTSYSYVEGIAVQAGAAVSAGDLVGWSTGRIHFGVRSGDEYIDPALLFTGGAPAVRLVPVGEPVSDPSGTASTERAALRGVVVEQRMGPAQALAEAGGLLGGIEPWLELGSAVSPFAHYAAELMPVTRFVRVVSEYGDWWNDRHDCTPLSVPTPSQAGERRLGVLIGGLGSSSDGAAIDDLDTARLGYASSDVVRFSYSGGRTPSTGVPDPDLEHLPVSSYGALETTTDLWVSAHRLRELLHDLSSGSPGTPIDVYAHSQGGVVAHLALLDGAGGAPLPSEVDLVVTLAAPHEGTDLATGAAAVVRTGRGRAALSWLDRGGGWFEAELPPGFSDQTGSVMQLAETAPLTGALGSVGPPPGVRMLTLAARGDLVVPAVHTQLPGADSHTIDLSGSAAHSRITSSAETTREVALALAEQPPSCETPLDALADLAVPEAISYVEDLLGALAAGVTLE